MDSDKKPKSASFDCIVFDFYCVTSGVTEALQYLQVYLVNEGQSLASFKELWEG